MNKLVIPNMFENVGASISNETLIQEYRNLYDQIKPLNQNRKSVLTSLETLLTSFTLVINTFEANRRVESKKIDALINEAEIFVKRNFSHAVYMDFMSAAVAPIQRGNWQFAAAEVITTMLFDVSITNPIKVRLQFNLLNKIKNCLLNYGLHPAIGSRDPKKHERHNIIIEYIENRKVEVECRLLLSWDVLHENFLSRISQNKKIIINGVTILPTKIKKTKVTTTLFNENEIRYFKEQNRLLTDLEFAQKCDSKHQNLVDVLLTGPQQKNSSSDRKPFLQKLTEGIQSLQNGEERHLKIRKSQPVMESDFRDCFERFFSGSDYKVIPESLQRSGRCDLRIECPLTGAHIIEFKIWRKYNIRGIIDQTCKYLTDFEPHGYVFVVNPTLSNINSSYKEIIVEQEPSHVLLSWKECNVAGTNFSYFESLHKHGVSTKKIYHFIYNLSPNSIKITSQICP